MMGSGKTTVGRALATMTGWPYVDNDALVAEVAGQATRQLEAGSGGDVLHAMEAHVVDEILAMTPPLVAGIPGSAVADDSLRGRLHLDGHVVWLRARIETLAQRIGDGGTRPFFAGNDVTQTLLRLYAGREPLYAAVAHQVVDVDDLDPDTIARAIVAALPRIPGTP
jgi:shikimate kinase